MMSELTRLQAEATRLLTIYEEYKSSNDEFMRRKAHLDLDRFLMEHRETAILLMARGLQAEIDQLAIEVAQQQRRGWTRQSMLPEWYRKLRLRRSAKGGAAPHGTSPTRDA